MPKGMFVMLKPFDAANVARVPNEPGIYLVYHTQPGGAKPFYVGRSRVSMYQRLLHHLRGTGSRKIAAANKANLLFEYQSMISVEQAESVLIRELGTLAYGNLRRETDPADL
jgi:excinuclease UvrABC nuclease subunit